MLFKKIQLPITFLLSIIRPSFRRKKIGQQDLNCQPLANFLHVTAFSVVLLQLGSYFYVNGLRREKDCLLCSCPHFFLVLKHFHWVSKMEENVLPGKVKRNAPRSRSHNLEFWPIHQSTESQNQLITSAQKPRSLDRIRPACPLLQWHIVIFRGREETLAFCGERTVQSPPAARVGCSAKDGTPAWHYLDRESTKPQPYSWE